MAINKTQEMVNTLKILSTHITFESLSQSLVSVFDTIANSLIVCFCVLFERYHFCKIYSIVFPF